MGFANRINTLLKKASQLSTLCDVPVCLIGFTPDGELFTWPENQADLQSTLNLHKQHLAAANSDTQRPKKNKRKFSGDAPLTPAKKKRHDVSGCDNGSSSSSSVNVDREMWLSLEAKLGCFEDRIRVLESEKKTELEFAVSGEEGSSGSNPWEIAYSEWDLESLLAPSTSCTVDLEPFNEDYDKFFDLDTLFS